LESTAGAVKRVPCDFPDDSGVKCSSLVLDEYLKGAKVASLKKMGNNVYRFSYLRLVSDTKVENRHVPFLWGSLREAPIGDHYYDHRMDFQEPARPPKMMAAINAITGVDGRSPQLTTTEVYPVETFRSKFTGERLRREVTTLTVSHTGRYKRQSGFSCFETRRT